MEEWDDYTFEPIQADTSLSTLLDMSSKSLLFYINNRIYDYQERERVLHIPEIQDKLRKGILEESQGDLWDGFRYCWNYLEIEDIMELYNGHLDIVNDFFQKDINRGRKYIFFASIAEKDINTFVQLCLKDNEFYQALFSEADWFYSSFSQLNYETYHDLVLKMESENFPFGISFLSYVDPSFQERILPELKDSTIIKLLPSFHHEVISHFMMNDKRASYLYSKLPIQSFANHKISFPDELLKRKDFFAMLESDSLVEYRTTINHLEENNNVSIIERKVQEYYDGIISKYDPQTGMFQDYQMFFQESYPWKTSFITSNDLYFEANKNKDHPDSLKELLQKETKKKIIQVTIDSLFHDNYHNVSLNIRELLRFNQDHSFLDESIKQFYDRILHLEDYPIDQIIQLYETLKNKNINTIFYEDLRHAKDISYEQIDQSLYHFEQDKEHKDIMKSLEAGVDVYDLRNAEFTMLIRTKYQHKDNTNASRNCYSLISDKNTSAFSEGTTAFQYGYETLDKDLVSHVFEGDSFSQDTTDKSNSSFVNRLMSPEEIVENNSQYSEINIMNRRFESDTYQNKKPDFIIAYDEVSEKEIEEAKRLQIPIVIIPKTKDYSNNTIPFDREKDIYIDNSYDERNIYGR